MFKALVLARSKRTIGRSTKLKDNQQVRACIGGHGGKTLAAERLASLEAGIENGRGEVLLHGSGWPVGQMLRCREPH